MPNRNRNHRGNGGGRGSAPPNRSENTATGNQTNNRNRGNRNRSADEALTVCMLQYGKGNNFDEYERKLKVRMLHDYGYSAMFLKTDQYYSPPMVTLGEGVDAEDFDEDPILRLRVEQEVKNRENAIAKVNADKPGMFAFIKSTLSPESEERVRQHNNWALVEPEDNPLELWRAIKATHIVNAVGNATTDRAAARDHYYRLQQGPTETLQHYKDRFDSALRGITALGGTAPSAADQAIDFINRLDDGRYAQFKVDLHNSVIEGTGTYPASLVDAYNRASNRREVRRVNNDRGNGAPQAVFATSADMVIRQKYNKSNKKGDNKNNNNNNNNVTNNNQSATGTTATTNDTNNRKDNGKYLICYLCGGPHGISKCPHLDTATTCLRAQGVISNDEHAHVTTAEETNRRVAFTEQDFVAYTTLTSGAPDGVAVGDDDKPKEDDSDEENTTMLASNKQHGLGAFDVLLDNQASKSIFHQAALLMDIRSTSIQTVFKGVGGKIETDQVGILPFVGLVSYSPQSIANVLALGEVENKYQIDYVQGKSFTVIVNDNVRLTFWKRHNGLYVCNMKFVADMISKGDSQLVMVHTVREREAIYTKREVEEAKLARKFMREMGYSSVTDLVELVKSGMANPPVSVAAIYRANRIYGPDVASLKGKMKAESSKIVKIDPEHIPREVIVEQTLHVDVMFIYSTPYLIAVSSPLGLTTVSCLDNRGAFSQRTALNDMIKVYRAKGFEVKTVLTDGEGAIAKLTTELNAAGIAVNPASAGKHVPVVENKIRQVKERVRATLHDLPYELPHVLMKYLVYFCVNRLNLLPSHLRMDKVSPMEALTGRKIDYKIHVRGSFGEYCQIEMPNVIKNSMQARTMGAILLHPTGNIQGTYHFYVMATGGVVARDRWVSLPIPQEVIGHMNKLAANDKHKITKDPVFRLNDRVIDGEAEQAVAGSADDIYADVPTRLTTDVTIDVSDVQDVLPVPADNDYVAPAAADTAVDTAATATPPVPAGDSYLPLHEYGTRARTKLIPTLTTIHDDDGDDDRVETLFHITVNQALRENPGLSAEAMMKELYQMLQKDVFRFILPFEIKPEQDKKALMSFKFFKQKFLPDGTPDKFKARLVAGGHMQDRDDAGNISSPTVTLSAVMMVAAIAKRENRKVVTVDITGAYLNASMKDRDVYMRLDKVMSGVMVHINPSLEKYLRHNGTMLVKLEKALYGCIEYAKLWYEELDEKLKAYGMKANPREPCVFNKVIANGKQITAIIYVDDLMITCKDENEIDKLCDYLRNEFETITMHDGVRHSYLGMTFDFGDDRGLVITMAGYEEDALKHYGVTGVAATPATNSLFEIDPSSSPLDNEESLLFHSKVAKLLYLALRTRPDILTCVSFLTTRVKAPTVEDNKKMDRLLRYLKGSKGKGIVINVSNDIGIKAYVDASYGVHADGKSHTGCIITLGEGPIFVRSAKQKLVSKSSTDAELIALSDSTGQVIWTREFLQFQGYDVGPAMIYQDNMSTIALVENGKSNSPGSRHINIRYFFIKDRIDKGEIVVEHLSTLQMIADYLTKALQGTAFREKRQLLLNLSAMD